MTWNPLSNFADHHARWHIIVIFVLVTLFAFDLVYEGATPAAKWEISTSASGVRTVNTEWTMRYHTNSIMLEEDDSPYGGGDPLYKNKPYIFRPRDLRLRNITAVLSSGDMGRQISTQPKASENAANWSKECDSSYEFSGTAYYIVMSLFLAITTISSVVSCGANTQMNRGLMMGAFFLVMSIFAFTRMGMMTHLLHQDNCHIDAINKYLVATETTSVVTFGSVNKDQMLTDIQFTGLLFALVSLFIGSMNVASAVTADSGSTMSSLTNMAF